MYYELLEFIKYIKNEDKQVVYIRDNTTTYIIKGYGDVNIKFIDGNEKIILDILYISRFAKNLFFAKQLDKAKGEICIKAKATTLIIKFHNIIAIYKLNSKLYELDIIIILNKLQISILAIIQFNKADLWHLRLEHKN
uniref:Retrovirus-related Pol polyprotein from transposon TNT 1-94-like beta-barrel domain-containing protein n=1 Tax=Physcomitrium patens TaxID=3218 RepID=A0A2K1IA55_PHYPA|nr:hypothetical protein PHYPA_030733 [Physcomitrium patens]